MNELLLNIDKLHTTQLGAQRIKRKAAPDAEDPVEWCRRRIEDPACFMIRKGKNWYATTGDCEITVNAHSYTIITAHSNGGKTCL